ncbi:MAG: competence protein ComEA [Candidatus Cloacimonadota bacterium]|nr:competence protein ComEA [Candidatus Cloacimonadota bacterium]
MKNPLNSLFTPDEQRILLFIAAFLILGSTLQLTGYQSRAADSELSDSLLVALAEDLPLQIDIRTATKEELMAISGIGEKRAQDILDYRTKHPFQNVNELLQVKGIGVKLYQLFYPDLLIFGDSLVAEPTAVDSISPNSEPLPPVNINTADIAELSTLSGIGKVKAQAIIDYRNVHGAFQSAEELTKVKGIGSKTLAKNRSRIKL